ncbi:hypothetical protein VCR4J2_80030 [Vibrio coralliirubri]|nr:hypothetical protein VCR4J2_80030 [Vibrio coralliirubri]
MMSCPLIWGESYKDQVALYVLPSAQHTFKHGALTIELIFPFQIISILNFKMNFKIKLMI